MRSPVAQTGRALTAPVGGAAEGGSSPITDGAPYALPRTPAEATSPRRRCPQRNGPRERPVNERCFVIRGEGVALQGHFWEGLRRHGKKGNDRPESRLEISTGDVQPADRHDRGLDACVAEHIRDERGGDLRRQRNRRSRIPAREMECEQGTEQFLGACEASQARPRHRPRRGAARGSNIFLARRKPRMPLRRLGAQVRG